MCARSVATHGSIVALPSESGIFEVGPVGEGEPALSLLGSPRQRAPPGSKDGERGVLHELVVAEPPEPLLQRLQAAVVVERRTKGVDQAGDGVRLARCLPVADRLLGQIVGDAPGHRTSVERRHHLRLGPLELVPEELAEEVVVAVPLAPPVERHDEAVCALERLERVRRPRRLEHGVAESAAHPLQDRRVLEEPRLSFRQPRQKLEAEVLGHEPVAAGKALGAHRACRPGLHRQRRQVQAGRPSLRPLGQLGELAVVELDSRGLEQHLCLLLVQPEVCHADLVHRALRPPAAEGQGRLFPACDRDLRARWDVPGELGEHVQTGRIGDRVQVVERQHQRALACGQRAADARDARRPGGCPWAGQRVEHFGRDRLDSVNRRRDVPQEHDGVVVSPVESDPGERTRIGLGPTRKQRRLAVPGGRDHGRQGHARGAQPCDHRLPSPRCRAGATAQRAWPPRGRKELPWLPSQADARAGREADNRVPPLPECCCAGADFHAIGMRRTGPRTPILAPQCHVDADRSARMSRAQTQSGGEQMTVSSETLRSIGTPEQLETRLGTLEFVDGVPSGEAVENVYDHLDFVHGLNVYLDGFAGASTYAIRKGFHDAGVDDNSDPHLLGADGVGVRVPDRERRHRLLPRHRRSHVGADGRRDASAGARGVRRHVVGVDHRLRPAGPGSRRRRPLPARPARLRRPAAGQRLPRRALAHVEGAPARAVVPDGRRPGPDRRDDQEHD